MNVNVLFHHSSTDNEYGLFEAWVAWKQNKFNLEVGEAP